MKSSSNDGPPNTCGYRYTHTLTYTIKHIGHSHGHECEGRYGKLTAKVCDVSSNSPGISQVPVINYLSPQFVNCDVINFDTLPCTTKWRHHVQRMCLATGGKRWPLINQQLFQRILILKNLVLCASGVIELVLLTAPSAAVYLLPGVPVQTVSLLYHVSSSHTRCVASAVVFLAFFIAVFIGFLLSLAFHK